jgi:hypothetical protein
VVVHTHQHADRIDVHNRPHQRAAGARPGNQAKPRVP